MIPAPPLRCAWAARWGVTMGAMGANLLIVEDDDGIRTALRLAMQDEGYDVQEAASAETGLKLVADATPEAMLVDLMLGGIDGYTFIRKARTLSDAPIVVISALNATENIVDALESGADDYVSKPFKTPEIAARLRALRRRTAAAPGPSEPPPPADDPGTVVIDERGPEPLVLDLGAGVLRRGPAPVHLTVTEFRLLRELASPPGRVLSRSALLDRVWDRGFFGDERIVDVHVSRLRTKIEAQPGTPVLLVTVRGQGYRLDVGRA